MAGLEWIKSPTELDFAQLGALLTDAVQQGASVNFIEPPNAATAQAWWKRAAFEDGTELLVWREPDDCIRGCVRLMRATQPNGLHRADVGKLLVHSGFQRRGIASALMNELESHAHVIGITLLILDTETDSYADGFYRRHGWVPFGTVPGHSVTPAGELTATTYFFKQLGPTQTR